MAVIIVSFFLLMWLHNIRDQTPYHEQCRMLVAVDCGQLALCCTKQRNPANNAISLPNDT